MSNASFCVRCGEMTSDGTEETDANGNGLGYTTSTPCRCKEEQEHTMNDDDPFRDWLVEQITELRDDHTYYRERGEGWTARKVHGRLDASERIVRVYDAMKAAAAKEQEVTR